MPKTANILIGQAVTSALHEISFKENVFKASAKVYWSCSNCQFSESLWLSKCIYENTQDHCDLADTLSLYSPQLLFFQCFCKAPITRSCSVHTHAFKREQKFWNMAQVVHFALFLEVVKPLSPKRKENRSDTNKNFCPELLKFVKYLSHWTPGENPWSTEWTWCFLYMCYIYFLLI